MFVNPDDKCRACFKDRRHCGGKAPYDEKCTRCRRWQGNQVKKSSPIWRLQHAPLGIAIPHNDVYRKQPR
ncbi:hypothetical protein HBH98_243890 [Parastagonospora nodorum]|nr:hypothetical protein HBH98_243890 [Parastagonospora nodorum]KAH4368755.1 hypothetical protein HBH99_245040 [Parastagonospora nodorum]